MILRLTVACILLAEAVCVMAQNGAAPDQAAHDSAIVGPGAYRVGGAVTAPTLTYSPDPDYSDKARKAHYQGTVVLSLIVDEKGLPQNIRAQRSLGMGLDEEAVKAVERWRFQPATKDGHPVRVMINVQVKFRLSEDLSPDPASAADPPQFPGVDTAKYPLVVRVSSHSYSGPGTAPVLSHKATFTDAGHVLQGTISCAVASSQCLTLGDGTYPARWKENMKTLEILGLSENGGKWRNTEYTASIEPTQ